MELVAFIGDDKQTWGQITGLIKRGEWEKIVLIKTKEAKEFPDKNNTESIYIDTTQSLTDLKKEITSKVKGKLSGLEVSLSIASGNGKEHMALISALLTLPVGIRFTVFTKNGVEFIN